MSLLMDALRKAERDKKKAADDTHEQAARPDAGDLSADAEPPPVPLEEESTEPLPRAGDEESTEPISRMPDMESTEPLPHPRSGDVSLELEPLSDTPGERDSDRSFEGSDQFDWADIEDQTARRFRATEKTQNTRETPTMPGEPRPAEPYDQESTLPSERNIQRSLQDYFEASRSMERPGVHLDGNEPEQEIDTGVRESTHVDAQTVFAAGESSAPSRYLRWTVAAVLVLAVTLGAVGFWYYYLTPTPRGAPPPSAVRSVPTPAPAPATPAARPQTPPPQSATTALAQAEGTSRAEVARPPAQPAPPPSGQAARKPAQRAASSAETHVSASAPSGGVKAAGAQTGAPASAPAEKASASRSANGSKAGQGASAATQKTPAAPARTAIAQARVPNAKGATRSNLPQNITVAPSAIQITHNKPAVKVSEVLNNAYRSFRSGQLDRAERLYRTALKQQDDQRDALLGLAAIAVQRGETGKAYALYMRILKLNPQDPLATAAIASLTGGGASADTEARLKMLLDQNPSAGYLHFALGNLYARDGHWPAAQQEYFDAYRSDDENADYAYNLAVSLDRLGSSGAALTYYQKALELADRQASRFSTTEVMARIKALSAVVTAQ